MGEPSLLLSFVGNCGLGVEHSEDFGPERSLLQARPFDRVILFCTAADYLEGAKMVEELCHGFGCAVSFRQVSLELESPSTAQRSFASWAACRRSCVQSCGARGCRCS